MTVPSVGGSASLTCLHHGWPTLFSPYLSRLLGWPHFRQEMALFFDRESHLPFFVLQAHHLISKTLTCCLALAVTACSVQIRERGPSGTEASPFGRLGTSSRPFLALLRSGLAGWDDIQEPLPPATLPRCLRLSLINSSAMWHANLMPPPGQHRGRAVSFAITSWRNLMGASIHGC